jgi:hypothetical protein
MNPMAAILRMPRCRWLPVGQYALGYDDNYHGLTPEQYMLGDCHQVF